jgi:hypothetical protein
MHVEMKSQVIDRDMQRGKSVGKTREEEANYDRLVDIAEAIMPRLPFPNGVYRSNSFEEADAWMEKHILRAARKNSHERQG